MNFAIARDSIRMAIAQRNAARALAYSAPRAAAFCRQHMRRHAKEAIANLRPSSRAATASAPFFAQAAQENSQPSPEDSRKV